MFNYKLSTVIFQQLENGEGPSNGGALSVGKEIQQENDDDSSDDNMSYDFDDSSDDCGNEEDDGLHRGCQPRLEWDHSTMSI